MSKAEFKGPRQRGGEFQEAADRGGGRQWAYMAPSPNPGSQQTLCASDGFLEWLFCEAAIANSLWFNGLFALVAWHRGMGTSVGRAWMRCVQVIITNAIFMGVQLETRQCNFRHTTWPKKTIYRCLGS